MRWRLFLFIGLMLSVCNLALAVQSPGHHVSAAGNAMLAMAMVVALVSNWRWRNSHSVTAKNTPSSNGTESADDGFEVNARRALQDIGRIGQDTFEKTLETLTHDEVRQSIAATHEQIRQMREKDQANNWIVQGVAEIVSIKHNGQDTAAYANDVLTRTVKYIGANQGGFFQLTDREDDAHFELIAAYAYGKKKFAERRINPGDGILGQMYYEKTLVVLNEIPKDYLKITSGLGEALPRNLCLLPLLSEGHLYGVIELASFQPFKVHETEFLQQIGEHIGYNLGTIQQQKTTETLLQETQKMADEVRNREEELQQNVEELRSTQETMTRERSKLEMLSLVADSTQNAVVISDSHGRITYTNDGFTRLTGYTFDEVAGKRPASFLQGPLTNKSVVARVSAKLKAGEPVCEEILNYNKVGHQYWVSMLITPIRNSEGVVDRYISVQSDITEIKRISIDLESKLDSISRTNIVIEFDAAGNILTANDYFFRITEYRPEDIIGKGYLHLVHPDDRDKAQTQMMWESIFSGQAFTGEFRFSDNHGNIQWISGSYNPVMNLNGSVEKILLLGQFVTSDKEKMNELQRTLSAIDACIPTMEIKADMGLKTANKAFLSQTGIRRVDLKRLSVLTLFGETGHTAMTSFASAPAESSLAIELLMHINDNETRMCRGTLFKLYEGTDNKLLLVFTSIVR